MNANHLPAMVSLLTIVLMFWTSIRVGKARGTYGIKAPATTGNLDFERIFRVQMNTLENAVMFLPSLWLFTMYVSPLWASLVGTVWLVGRVWYVLAYSQDASKRGPGFGIGTFALATLAVGALIGVVLQMFHGGF